jgi:tetratricopeptide (TPR) repeat protein
VFTDRLRITGEELRSERLAAFLLMLGNYWRRPKEYGRAIERIRRAIELDSSCASAHKALGRAMWNAVAEALAASNIAPSPNQIGVLEQAETELNMAQSLLGAKGQHDEEIPFDLGTISRFKGDVAGAVDHYQRGAQLSKVLAATEGREPDWDFEFALACLYAKTNQFQLALDELRGMIGKTKSWSQERRRVESRDYRIWMRSDPDFSDMLSDPAWNAQLLAL